MYEMKSSVAASTRDYTSNTVLTLNGDKVEEFSYVFSVQTNQQPIVIASGTYTGHLEKMNGRWCFKYRRLDIDSNYDAAQVPSGDQ